MEMKEIIFPQNLRARRTGWCPQSPARWRRLLRRSGFYITGWKSDLERNWTAFAFEAGYVYDFRNTEKECHVF